MALRPFQKDSSAAIRTDFAAGIRKLVVVLPTGTGKTVVFSNLPKAEHFGLDGKKMMVLAHRDELVNQAVEKIRKWNPTLRVGIEKAEQTCDPSRCDVVVSSPQTLGRAGSKRIEKFNPLDFRILVIDECHHVTLEGGYARVANYLDHPGLLHVGFTATPNRPDGKGLDFYFEKISYQMTMREAIEQGWLVDVRGLRVSTKTSLDGIKNRAGDFAQDELQNAVNTPERNEQVAQTYIDYAWPRPALVFTVDIQHAKDMAFAFQQKGLAFEAVWGDDPDRAAKLERHRRGELLGLANCGVLTEGYDDWRIACIMHARPTQSQLLYTQITGRGTRLPEGIDNLLQAIAQGVQVTKRDCLVIDFVDNCSRNSLVTLPSLFGMNKDLDLKGKSAVGAIKKLEEVERENPNIDLNQLRDFDKLKSFVEEVNLWEVSVPPEISCFSQMRWQKRMDGSYSVSLPGMERVTLRENVLGQYEVDGTVKKQSVKETGFGTLEDAERFAALRISAIGGPKLINTLKAEWKSGGDPMTGPQERSVRRIFQKLGRPMPAGLTKGQATNIINNYSAKLISGR